MLHLSSAPLLKFVSSLCMFYVLSIAGWVFKGSRMGHPGKVSRWYVTLLINTRFRCFYFRIAIVKRI